MEQALISLAEGVSRRVRPDPRRPDGDPLARRLWLRAAGAELPRLLGVHEEALLWLEAAIELTATAVLLRPESIAEGLARAARRAAEYRLFG